MTFLWTRHAWSDAEGKTLHDGTATEYYESNAEIHVTIQAVHQSQIGSVE